MSSNLGTILSFIASLAIVTPILKFFFLPSYRTYLKRSKYVEKRELLQTYYNDTYLKRNEKNKFVLQEDTNVLMSHDKYSYQLIFQILESNSQYFYRMIDNLKFCNWYLKEVKNGDNFILTCRFSKKNLKLIFNSFLTLYLVVGLFWFFGNLFFYITTGKILNNTILDLIIICTLLPAFAAGKAKATLKLSKILDIKFKDD
ncbi:hypothetical protein [Acinetobacter beijerinckii]|uniref:Uncharacterized protein n=1 Tax=Acinetobacter beijerinckii ANC 3835 TaxID=1217649 RepID=N9FK96_9GAMM|nr:hypothetical protein [Acinetobacter beijerinckii]ENW05274.1 hypothetical protein F934_01238 [Acinetobacter beijerinckii ANC 3835]